MHESSFRVRATQVDLLRHLNNASYLELFEWARWEWAETGNRPFLAMMNERDIGPVIVHADVRFRSEVRFHERVRIITRMESCNRRRGVMHQRMLREDGALASEGRFTFVAIDLKQRKVVSIPDEMLALVEPGEE